MKSVVARPCATIDLLRHQRYVINKAVVDDTATA